MSSFIPFSGSYLPEDIHFLLKPIEIEMTPVAQKEQLIQSGTKHYSEMLSQEPEPTRWHLDLFSRALDKGAVRLAKEVGWQRRWQSSSLKHRLFSSAWFVPVSLLASCCIKLCAQWAMSHTIMA